MLLNLTFNTVYDILYSLKKRGIFMEKVPKNNTTKDIETKLDIQERINSISKKIDKKRKTY